MAGVAAGTLRTATTPRLTRWACFFLILFAASDWGEIKFAHVCARDCLFYKPLNISQLLALVAAHQRDRQARCTRAACSTDTMHIILGHMGKIEIDHRLQLMDVDSARCNVGSNKHLYKILLKGIERLGALCLRFVAMNGRRSDAVFRQLLHQIIGPVFSAAKDQSLARVRSQDSAEQLRLLLLLYLIKTLSNNLNRRVTRRHIYLGGLVANGLG